MAEGKPVRRNTKDLGQRLSALGTGLELIDAPVSGGVVRAASGNLTIISSGAALALSKASPVLTALSGPPSNLHTIPNGAGAALNPLAVF